MALMITATTKGVFKMYRPQTNIEKKVRKAYEEEIFKNFKVGVYDNKDDITKILNLSFEFYEKILNDHLEKSASIHMLAHTLSEYDNYCELTEKHKKGTASKKEKDFFNEHGSKTKRALKYIAEKIVCHLPNEIKKNPNKTKAKKKYYENLSYCWIAAEEMVSLYMSSLLSFSLFPDDCKLKISENTNYNFIEVECEKITSALNTMSIHEFYSAENDLSQVPPFDPNVQNRYFEEVFKTSFSLDYSSCLYLIQSLIGYFETDKKSTIKSHFFDKRNMISLLASDYSNYNVSEDQIDRILAGFSLSKENLQDRILYKPKQEYRASRRAFFEVKDGEKEIVLFSKSMALEEFDQLVRNVSFRKLPSEWLNLDQQMNTVLANFSNYTGSWFEEYLTEKLHEKGFKFEKSLKKIIADGKTIYVPADVGDIDVLAQVGNCLHIIECKMVQFASEPTGYIDDVDKFITRDKSYRAKFNKKISWVEDNKELIKKHLISKGFEIDSELRIETFMITFFPTITSDLISEFKCIDINKYLCKLSSQ